MPAAPQTRTRIVQSRHNARLKELRAALARPRTEVIGLEGLHLVQEALRSRVEVQSIFVANGAEQLLDALDAEQLARVREILFIPKDMLQGAVTTQAPQAMAALAVPPLFSLEQIFHNPQENGLRRAARAPLLLVLAGVQDPGNVGAILRSAEAFGANGLLTLPGTASIWNPKSLRASMGSAFRLPALAVSAGRAVEILRTHAVRSLAAVAPNHAGAEALGTVDLRSSVALWIGNEGAGLSAELFDACDAAVTIPCPGPVESLNAAIATGVLLYEASRQRADFSQSAMQKAHPRPA